MKTLSRNLYSFILSILVVLPLYAGEGAGQVKPVKIPVISVPVVQNDRIVTNVIMEFEILTNNNQQAGKVVEFMARIRDKIFKDMYAILGTLWLPGFEVTPEFVLGRVRRSIDELFPEDWVKDIKITRLIAPKMPSRRS